LAAWPESRIHREKPLIRICAWCTKPLDDKPHDPADDQEITHGICDDCMSNIKAQMGVPLHEFLDGMNMPVILVDKYLNILDANENAKNFFGKPFERIRGIPCGEVFECENARLPGGCGDTIHCSGCAIRRLVTDTYRNNTIYQQVPAYLNRNELEKNRRLDMTISSENAGDIVVLRIDKFGFETAGCESDIGYSQGNG
jgi:PAS domain-containing protein